MHAGFRVDQPPQFVPKIGRPAFRAIDLGRLGGIVASISLRFVPASLYALFVSRVICDAHRQMAEQAPSPKATADKVLLAI